MQTWHKKKYKVKLWYSLKNSPEKNKTDIMQKTYDQRVGREEKGWLFSIFASEKIESTHKYLYCSWFLSLSPPPPGNNMW